MFAFNQLLLLFVVSSPDVRWESRMSNLLTISQCNNIGNKYCAYGCFHVLNLWLQCRRWGLRWRGRGRVWDGNVGGGARWKVILRKTWWKYTCINVNWSYIKSYLIFNIFKLKEAYRAYKVCGWSLPTYIRHDKAEVFPWSDYCTCSC